MASAHDADEPPSSANRVVIQFTDDALDDLRRLARPVARRVLLKLDILLRDPRAGRPLGGPLAGFRKIIIGNRTWRVVYRVTDSGVVEVCEIWAIGGRADSEVYREATRRVAEARASHPELSAMAQILESLGTSARGLESLAPAQEETVPAWLTERLIRTVGLRPEVAAALTLDVAIARWEKYMQGDR